MADIDIERKARPVWPWVLGLLLLAALIWAAVEMAGDGDERVAVEPAPTAVPPPVAAPAPTPVANGAVEAYTGECTSASEARDEMSRSHEFEANCIRLLSAALNSVVERDTVGSTALQPAVAEYRQRATALEQTAETSPEHADMLRAVAISATDLMARVQETRTTAAPGLEQEVAQARSAAEAIQGGTPLLEQRRETGEFFHQAGEALRMMAQ